MLHFDAYVDFLFQNCFLVLDLGGAINSAYLKAVVPMALPRSLSLCALPSRLDNLLDGLALEQKPAASADQPPPSDGDTGAPLCVNDIVVEEMEAPKEAVKQEVEEEEEDSCSELSPAFLLGANLRLRSHAHSFQVTRQRGFRHGLVIGRRPLAKLQLFQARVDRLAGTGEWREGLSLGFIMSAAPLEELFPTGEPLPDAAHNLLAGRAALAAPDNLAALSFCQVRPRGAVKRTFVTCFFLTRRSPSIKLTRKKRKERERCF